MGRTVSDLSCYLTIIHKAWGERVLLAKLLSPHTRQRSGRRCLAVTPLPFLWFSRCWHLDLRFSALSNAHMDVLGSHTVEAEHEGVWTLPCWYVKWAQLCGSLNILWIGMKTDFFQSFDNCWVFQICWHVECSTLRASSFRILNAHTHTHIYIHIYISLLLHHQVIFSSSVISWAVVCQAPLSMQEYCPSILSSCPRQDYWSGSLFPSPGIFLTQESNPRFLHFLHWQAPANAGDVGLISGGGNSNPLQYSCMKSPINREAWSVTVHGIRHSWACTPLYTCIKHLYPFICSWTFKLLLCLACWKQCCSEHRGTFLNFSFIG